MGCTDQGSGNWWPYLVPRSHSVLHLAVGDLGTRLLVTYTSHCLRPNLVRLSYLSCSDHFCFYHRFGLVTFQDCTNWGPLLQKCLKKRLLTRKEKQDRCEHWLLENEEYSDEKETKKYSICYFEKLTNVIFHCGGGSLQRADHLTQFWGGWRKYGWFGLCKNSFFPQTSGDRISS